MNGTIALGALKAASAWYAQNYYKDKDPNNPNDPAWNFWQKSNQLDSYIRLATLVSHVYPSETFWKEVLFGGPDPQVKGLIVDFQQTVTKALDLQTDWSDDYGWGGMACLSTAEYIKSTNPTSKEWETFRDLGIKCFEIQCSRWDCTLNARPVFHGLSNSPPAGDPANYAKNTVTNANFMALSMQLYDFLNANPDPSRPNLPSQALGYAYEQFLWFFGWINTKADPANGIPYNYYHRTLTTHIADAAMLEERPVAYPPGTYPVTLYPSFTEHATWSGDQGLFLNACALLYLYADDLTPSRPTVNPQQVKESLRVWMQWITRGVYHCLCGPNVDGVLREAPFENIFRDDPGDYVCGRGVLARLLNREATRTVLQQIGGGVPDFAPIWGSTSSRIVQTQKGGLFKASWNNINNLIAYDRFKMLWGDGDAKLDWNREAILPEGLPVWDNYCQMMGFDILGAYLRSSLWQKDWRGEIKEFSENNGHI